MLQRCLAILCLFFVLGGLNAKTQAPPDQPYTPPPKSIAPFTHVFIEGAIDVNLHTGSKLSQIKFHADPRDLAYLSWSDSNGILRIHLGKGQPQYGRVQVEINTRYLSQFAYRGRGTIMAKNIRSSGLDLQINNQGKASFDGQIVLRTLKINGTGFVQVAGIKSRHLLVQLAGSPRVQLSGVANVASVDAKGASWFSLYWVKSDLLNIKACDEAFIQMAGIVKMLDVELKGKAKFNGRYLRAQRSFIKTHDYAQADIVTVLRQHTLALGASNIYFHNLPDMQVDFMAMNGAVLDLREWENPAFKEPRRGPDVRQ